MNALTEEMYLSGAPVDGLGVANLVAHTLLHRGHRVAEGRDHPEGPLGRGAWCCLGYSEPDAGSDVAACATKAVRDGDEWVVDGQKMFTTLAHESQYVFLLARTNTEVAKHKGLTMFVVPMDTAGHQRHPGPHHGRRAHQHHLVRRRAGRRTATGSARSTVAGR